METLKFFSQINLLKIHEFKIILKKFKKIYIQSFEFKKLFEKILIINFNIIKFNYSKDILINI